jgi:hypothetical protein
MLTYEFFVQKHRFNITSLHALRVKESKIFLTLPTFCQYSTSLRAVLVWYNGPPFYRESVSLILKEGYGESDDKMTISISLTTHRKA